MFLWVGVPLKFMCSNRWAMPVSPYPSWREPTNTVQITDTFGVDGSG